MFLNQGNNHARYDGRVSTKLSVITDPKKIKEYLKDIERRKLEGKLDKPLSRQLLVLPQKPRPVRAQPFLVLLADSPHAVALKFVQYLALGPASDDALSTALGLVVTPETLSQLKQDYAQLYDRSNQFYQDDRFPTLESARRRHKHEAQVPPADVDVDIDDVDDIESTEDELSLPELTLPHWLLKDKSYKELQPWEWSRYSQFEHKLIIHNIHRALTRLGFSETHPLRRKICDPNALAAPSPSQPVILDDERRSHLGGGILVQKGKKSSEPPKMATRLGSPAKPKSIVPVAARTGAKRKFSLSLLSLSDDDKHAKKLKMELDTLPLLEEDDTPLLRRAVTASPSTNDSKRRIDYYQQLAVKFRDRYKEYATLYTKLKNPSLMSKAELKRQLLKLFELHTQLSGWKKKLWDYDLDVKKKLEIMALTKHKKVASSSSSSMAQAHSPRQPPSRPASVPTRPRLAATTSSSRPRLPLNY